jgi:hypothetical protein
VEPDPNHVIMNQLYADIKADIAEQVRKVDEVLRARFAGRDADDVRDSAEAALADIGLHLSDEQLDDYARCVSHGLPFEFVLG